jgi:hypothetical protein
MPQIIARVLKILICAVLIAQLSGCGTIFYPERRGQKAGRIDAGVAVLDGLGLLVFIVPGVIAFAVDFTTGAIYIPRTSKTTVGERKVKIVRFDPKHCTKETIEVILKRETGLNIKLTQKNIRMYRLRSMNDVKSNLAKAF